MTCVNGVRVEGGTGSGEAEGAGGGGEGADGCGEAVEGRVGEREEEKKEEENPEQVGGEDGEAMGVFQSSADGRESHVVTEGVAEDRTHQVTCSDENKSSVGPKHSCVGELEHCREEDS